MILIIFYVVLFSARVNMATLREGGWVFDIPAGSGHESSGGEAKAEARYAFYSYFSE